MKITHVHFESCFNIGNYENEKIRMVAELQSDETPERIIETLRDRVREAASPDASNMLGVIWERRRELKELEEKLAKRTQEWNATAEFLRAQGIKADAQDMPMFTNLLAPSPETEQTEVIEADLEEF
jgi:hypothetical protein